MRRITVLALCLMSSLSMGSSTDAQAFELPASAGLDVMTKYVWRGSLLVDKLSVQPNASVAIGASGLRLGVWGSFATQERDTYDQLDRVDLMAEYSRSLGAVWEPLSLTVGFATYTFPNGPDGSQHTEEGYVGFEAALPFVQPSLMVYRDFNEIEGTYVQAGISPPASLLSAVPIPGLDLQLRAALSDYTDAWSFHDLSATLAFNLPLMGLLQAGPMAGFSYADDSVNPGGDNTNWWAGVGVSLGPQATNPGQP